jgi:hypothetical protein
VGLNLIFLGVAIVIIGGGLFFPARGARNRDRMRQGWPTAKGTVTSCEVVQPAALAAGGSQASNQYDVKVQFQFRAGGQLHFGSTVAYPRTLYGKQEADGLAAKYPAGGAATVYYDPEDFRTCYLEIRTTAKYYRMSIVLMVIGGLVGLYGILQTFA